MISPPSSILRRFIALPIISCLAVGSFASDLSAAVTAAAFQTAAHVAYRSVDFGSQAVSAKPLGVEKPLYPFRISGDVPSFALLKHRWEQGGRSWVNLALWQARHGILFYALIQAGSVVGNFVNRGARLSGYAPAVLMAWLWIPGFIAYGLRQWIPGIIDYGLRQWSKRSGFFRRPITDTPREPLRWRSPSSWLHNFPVEVILLLGLFSQAGYILTFAYLSPVSANAIMILRPILVSLTAVFYFKEHRPGLSWLAFAASFLSAALQIWASGGVQKLGSGAWFALATLVLTYWFYVIQYYLVSKKRIPVDPTRLTFLSGLVNSVGALLWLAAGFGVSKGFHLLISLPIPLWITLIALSLFNIFLKYSAGTKAFQNNTLGLTTISEFFSQPENAGLNWVGPLVFGWLGIAGLFEPVHFLSKLSLAVSLVAFGLAFLQADIRLQQIKDQRQVVSKILGQEWPPAVGFLGSESWDFSRILPEFIAALVRAGLPPRTGDLRPLTTQVHGDYIAALKADKAEKARKAGKAEENTRQANTETQAVWDSKLFERHYGSEVQRVIFLAHHTIRKEGFLTNLRALVAGPGRLRTRDKVFQAWKNGIALFLVEVSENAEEAFWGPCLAALEAGWKATGHWNPSLKMPRVLRPSQLKDALTEMPDKPVEPLSLAQAIAQNAVLAYGILKMHYWKRAVAMIGDPLEGTPELEIARLTARRLFAQGVAVRVEGRGALYRAVWEEALKVDRELLQSVVALQPGEKKPPRNEGPEKMLATRDDIAHNVFLTKKTLAQIYFPGPVPTLSTFHDSITHFYENAGKRRPVVTVGRTRFWGAILQDLIPDKGPSLFNMVDTVEEVFAVIGPSMHPNGDGKGGGTQNPWYRRLMRQRA